MTRDYEGDAVTKLLQGWVAGALGRDQRNLPLDVRKVDVPADEHGNYKDYIEVTLGSGRKIHILFTHFGVGEDPT